jgi:hypothetical protein
MDAPAPARSVSPALAVVGLVVSVEYAARHILAPLLPVLANPAVNDMLVVGVVYIALSLGVARVLGRRFVRAAMDGVLGAMRRWEAWVGGVTALAVAAVLALADRRIWVPSSSPRSPSAGMNPPSRGSRAFSSRGRCS